ncbi:hypothetical protein [Nakamurella endophytica]|uniref:Uncharacterized protein n=1 Tax=Nakamurella endophytica TaxID=1748367 RepID=A0A917SUT6_9ACTN|nr:hypothetical protein [Nakamurella endophytica]GGL97488.1 hypothetical protein GCM10011594_16640 [Nakamurella endophytica]
MAAFSATVLGTCLAGAGGASAETVQATAVTASAGPEGGMHIESSRGFNVRNMSHYTLKLVRIDGDNKFEGRPDIGTTISPGQSQRFEVLYKYLSNQRDDAVYDVLDGSTTVGSFTAKMGVMSADDFWGAAKRYTDCTSTTGTCTHDDENITFLNDAGTVKTITDGQAQAAVLNQWCNESTVAKCTFDIKSRESVLTESHQSGPGYGNDTSSPITKKLTTTEKVGVTDSVEVNASTQASIARIVEMSVNAKYGKTWVSEYEFTDETTLTLQPHTFYWPVSVDPMTRYTGDFTITMGNTTWHLTNVYLQTANPNGHASVTWKERPITTPQAASAPSITGNQHTTVSTYGFIGV